MRILEAVAAPGGPHRLTDVVAAAAVPKSSTFRILASLIEQGFVRPESDARYGVGPRLRGLSALVSGGEPQDVGRILGELREAVGQTVHLALHSGETLTYIRKLESDQPFRTASRVGMQMPLHSTAIGKSILAHLPEEQVRALIERGTAAPHSEHADQPRGAAGGAGDGPGPGLRHGRRGERGDDPVHRRRGPGPRGSPVGGVSITTVTFLVSREEIEAYAPALRAATQALAPLL